VATTTPLRSKRPTEDIAPTTALRSSTEGTISRADQAVASQSRSGIANIGRSTKPTRSVANTPEGEVEYFRKRDRLLRLNWQASQKIALNFDEKFPADCTKRQNNLKAYLNDYLKDMTPKLQLEDYFGLIPCMGKPSESGDNPDAHVPYICVLGLQTHQAVKIMNAVLCKSKARELYHPHIRICYDLSKVDACASDNTSVVYATPSTTLCGTLAIVKHQNEQRTVTIGGLIKVADRLYAITTSHIVSTISEGASRKSSDLLDDIISDIDDYDDDVESALVIGRETEESSSTDEKSSPIFTNSRSPTSVDFGSSKTLGTLEQSGLEWSLIRIQNPSLQLPNFAANEEEVKTVARITRPERSYISSVAEFPSSMTVTVLAGASGQVKARLSPNEAYTHLPSGDFVQTWTLSFENGTGKHIYDSSLT
jgi:hypothetical protein